MRMSLVISLAFLLLGMAASGCGRDDVPKLKVGDRAPQFSLQDMDGKPLRLADMKGSPVVLRFFLTDCKYCRADTPVFNKLFTKYQERGLHVLYIDSLGIAPEVVRTFARELGILFPVAQDKEGEVSARYNVRALPQTIVLDPEHTIRAAILGGISEPEMMQLLSPYFPEEGEKK